MFSYDTGQVFTHYPRSLSLSKGGIVNFITLTETWRQGGHRTAKELVRQQTELSGSRQRGMKLTQTSGMDELGGGYVPVLSTRYQAPLGVHPTVLTILALAQHR